MTRPFDKTVATQPPDPMRELGNWAISIYALTVPWQGLILIPGVGRASRLAGIVATLICMAILGVRYPKQEADDALMLGGAFLAWAAISAFWADPPTDALLASTTIVQLLLMFYLLREFIDTRKRWIRVSSTYLVGSLFAAALILRQYAQNPGQRRYSGADQSGNVNDLAFAMALSIPIAWYLALRAESRLVRAACGASIPVLLAGVVLTGSRGGLISALICLLAVPWTLRDVDGRVRVLLTIVVIAASPYLITIIPEEPFERLGETQESVESGDLTGRTTLWAAALEIAEDRPLIGTGAGALRYQMDRKIGVTEESHNTFLNVFVQYGAIGFTLFALFLVVSIRKGVKGGHFEQVILGLLALSFVVGLQVRHWELNKSTWIFLVLIWSGSLLSRSADEHPIDGARGSGASGSVKRRDRFVANT